MRKNGRSLAGGSATDGCRSGPEATASCGGCDSQGGWLDCRSEFVLFHKHLKKLSSCLRMSANGRIDRSDRAPRLGACQSNHQSIDFHRIGPQITKNDTPHDAKSPKPNPIKAVTHQPTQYRNPIAPTANVSTPSQLLPNRHHPPGKFLRVFPHNTGIFDRRFKNPHIISTALPTAVGPSLRLSDWQAGQAKRLRNARRITMSFRTRRPLWGTARAGPRYATSIRRSVFMCLGRVPCPRPGCCSIAQVMPPLPV